MARHREPLTPPYLAAKKTSMGSKKPARIPPIYRILAIGLALLFIGWMLFVYRAGATPQ